MGGPEVGGPAQGVGSSAQGRGGGPRVGTAGSGVGQGPLTAPDTASAACGAGSDRPRRCVLASGPRAAAGWGGGSSCSPEGQGQQGWGGNTHRDPGCGGAAGYPRGCVVSLLGQADVSLQPVGVEPETRGAATHLPHPAGDPHTHLHQQRVATARAAAPATEHATASTAGTGTVRAAPGVGWHPLPAHQDLPRARPSPCPP